MHKYVIMGAQGCGKGTHARRLQQDFDLVHIAVGDIFRWHIQSHTKLGTQIQRSIADGQLVEDGQVLQVIQERLELHDWNFGFILDGFPRTTPQAEFFLKHYDIDAVIHIDVPDEVVFERVLARRQCSQCGRDYNLTQHRPADIHVCDDCGGSLIVRSDDNEAGLRRRLQEYHAKTEPILDLFRRKERVIQTDGRQSVEEIQADIRRQLDLKSPAS